VPKNGHFRARRIALSLAVRGLLILAPEKGRTRTATEVKFAFVKPWVCDRLTFAWLLPRNRTASAPPEKSRDTGPFAAGQSVLSSPVCRRDSATNGHLLHISEFLCSPDCGAQSKTFELSVQVVWLQVVNVSAG